jgi:hypothetical protein
MADGLASEPLNNKPEHTMIVQFIELVTEEFEDPTIPPDGWETKLVPKGMQPEFYVDFYHAPKRDFVNGGTVPTKRQSRVYEWLPNQPFVRQVQQPDDSWKDSGLIHGPIQYIDLGVWATDPIVRLVAQ